MLTEKKTLIYTVFHLNLAFSSIDKSEHGSVIKQCYWPLLKIIQDHNIPLGIELTAYTLETIYAIDPLWINCFAQLLKDNKCEVIASGDSQIIGPLVPYRVNENNIRLGNLSYQKYLGVKPEIAYVNEQAVSAGLLDCYIDQGFKAVVIEWDNPYSNNSDWSESTRLRPQTLLSASGREIKVIWNFAITFQKFQRYIHDEMTLEDYQKYLDQVIRDQCDAFIIYGSDVEVFDFRPVRYGNEAVKIYGEWDRITQLLTYLKKVEKYQWARPIEVLSKWKQSQPLTIQNAAHPISVKKQPKYNITRWGLSGRNDLWLNSFCYQQLHILQTQELQTDSDWRQLCRLWSSDYRTHLIQERYDELIKSMTPVLPKSAEFNNFSSEIRPLNEFSEQVKVDQIRNRIHIQTESIALGLNAKRGMSIESLAFKSHDFSPVIGTLVHGYFDQICYGADFYSNHLVIERFRQRDRVTDLVNVQYQVGRDEKDALVVECHFDTQQGAITKWYKIKNETIECGFEFSNKERPEASVRLGFMTLLNCDKRSWFATHNGGKELEIFESTENFDYGNPVSSIVSSNTALGATEGKVLFGNANKGVELNWWPQNCAALPMLSCKNIKKQFLNRLWFSLVESDETLKTGGTMMNFSFKITPCNRPTQQINIS